MSTVYERRKIKAVKRSQAATKSTKRIVKSDEDIMRLGKYKRRQIIFRRFEWEAKK